MVNVNVGDKVTLRYGRTVVTGPVTGVEYKESGNMTYVQLDHNPMFFMSVWTVEAVEHITDWKVVYTPEEEEGS